MTVGRIIDEPLKIHTKDRRASWRERVRWLLEKVGLSAAHAERYPHEFSGGQRQRIGIAHDLSVVRHISDRIAVMYLGRIVETGVADDIYRRPMHPYTRSLLAAVPRPDPDARKTTRATLGGDLPSPLHKPSGCAFRTRCPIARPACAERVPPLERRDGRLVACPYVESGPLPRATADGATESQRHGDS